MKSYPNLNIKSWAVEDRPREKLMAKGIGSLSNAELIAILIGSGTRNESAVEVSRKVLNNADNNLHELGKCSVKDLQKTDGIGAAKALSIVAALELGRRRKLSDVTNRKKITSSREVFEVFQPFLADLPHEEFWCLLLNRSNKIIEWFKISQGGIAGTVIDVRIILKKALEKLATSIIVAHNHPSGNLQPSNKDREITRKLKNAAVVMDIQVVDHLILADKDYYSFADEGILG